MGGRQVNSTGPMDDGYDDEGYDESQRAEIMEVERDGPGNGVIQTDLDPDLGEDEDLLGTEDGLSVLGEDDGDGNAGRRPDGDEEADLDEDGIEDEDDDDAEAAADEVEIR